MLDAGTILLVEDTESDAVLICAAFRKAKIVNPIFRVATSAEALLYLSGSARFADRKEHPIPEFILLDLALPDASGFELLKQIKADGSLAAIPVVIVTGNETPEAEQTALSFGASAFFRKVLRFEDLIEVVRRIGGHWSLCAR